MHIRTIFLLALGALISVVGFYLAFRNVPLDGLAAYSREVNYRWSLPALIVLAVTYAVRSLRWQLLLRPIGRIPLSAAYHSIIISFMINCILPGRVGEMARPLILKKTEGLPFTSTLATLAAERLLDLATLLALMLLALPGISFTTASPIAFGGYELSPALLMRLARTSIIGALLLMLGLFFIGHNGVRQRLFFLIRRITAYARILGPRWQTRITHATETFIITFLQRFADGLQYLSKPGHLLVMIALSMSTWVLNALSFYLVARGCPGIGLSFADILVMMVIICLFIALPSVPGYWGLWEAAGVFALAGLGIAREPAAGFTLFNHALQILPVIPAG
ncbi:MAG: flippase-like domain-containing protein [Desulfosarcina sp.]|nr:flippase-like domain-containing protein [Desulfobacterales bacterium]